MSIDPYSEPDRIKIEGAKSYIIEPTDLLIRTGIRIHGLLKTLHCLACQACYLPDDISTHMKIHDIHLSKDDVSALVADFGLHTNLKDIKLPYPGGPPVEFIKTVSGYSCRYCPHACPQEDSLKNHVRSHRDRSPLWDECIRKNVAIQTLFRGVGHKFFEVNCDLSEIPEDNIYTTIIRDYLPSQPPLPVRPAQTLREVEPLIQVTEWHTRMHDYIDDRSRRNHLLSLKAKPKTDEPGYCHIQDAVLLYLTQARDHGRRLRLTVRKIIMQGPTISQTNR